MYVHDLNVQHYPCDRSQAHKGSQGSLDPTTATLALHERYHRGTCGLPMSTLGLRVPADSLEIRVSHTHTTHTNMHVGESMELPPHLQTPYWGADYKHIS